MIDPETGDQNSRDDSTATWRQWLFPPNASLFDHILRGGLVCLIFGVLDNLILVAGTSSSWTGLVSYLAFGLFVAQAIVLSAIVGLGVRKHLVWWLFFGWSLGLVNLQLTLIGYEAGEGYRNSKIAFLAFCFAFYAAQIGLIIFWMFCGTFPWARIRVPIATATLMIACHPFWLLNSGYNYRGWVGLLTYFLIAAALTYGVLRYLRFQLRAADVVAISAAKGSQANQNAQGQFGIKHLFIWTTIVAVLFGIGGLVSWQALFNNLIRQNIVINLGRTLLITVSLVAVVWAVMGETKWISVRVFVLAIFLTAVSLALYGLDYSSLRNRQNSLAIGWRWWRQGPSLGDHLQMIRVWMIWTMLNGMFLAALLLVFRFAGFRFVRSAKEKGAKV